MDQLISPTSEPAEQWILGTRLRHDNDDRTLGVHDAMKSSAIGTECLLSEGREIAQRLNAESQSVTRIWAIVEAFNGCDESHRRIQHEALNSLGLGTTASVLIRGLIRDTLSCLLRMTDPPGKKGQRHTFCRIRQLLDDSDVVLALENEARNWQTDWGNDWQEQNVESVRTNVRFIKDLTPAGWTGPPPKDGRLDVFRKVLLPVRNTILAHAENFNDLQQPSYGQIRDLLKLVTELQAACSLVFLGCATDLQIRWEAHIREANEFWDLLNSRPNLSQS